MRHLQK
jgi:chromosome segregation ATPase